MVSDFKLPTRTKTAVLREEYYALTGNATTAMVLNQMMYWSERSKDADKFLLEEQERLEANGIIKPVELSNGWIYKSAKELTKELMNIASVRKIGQSLNDLVDLGYLSSRKNPDKRYGFDKTKHYRPNLLKLQLDLFKKGYTIPNYTFGFDLRSVDEGFLNNMEKSLSENQHDQDPPISDVSNKSTENVDIRTLELSSNRMEPISNRTELSANGLELSSNRSVENFQAIPETTTKTTSEIKSTKTKPTTDDEDDLSNKKKEVIQAIADQIKSRLGMPDPNPVQFEMIEDWVAVYDFGSIMNGIERAAEHGGKTYLYIQKSIKSECNELEEKLREIKSIPLRE